MARMRSIKPEFWMDRKLARLLSRDERMLYVGLWNQADEHGRCLGDPRVVQGTVFPYEDDLTVQDLDRMLDSLAKAGVIVRYSVDEDPYLWLPKLAQHQRLEPEKVLSRHPAPDDPSAVQIGSESHAESPGSHDSSSTLKHVACGMEHVAGQPGADESAPSPKPPRRNTAVPKDFAVTPELRSWAEQNAPRVNVDRQTEKFLNHHGAKGTVFKDWIKAWRNWMLNAVDYGHLEPGSNEPDLGGLGFS